MQPTEQFNVPRRSLDVEDYIDILRRHKGWIFGPFLFCLVVSVVGVYLWPDTYISKGIIKVEPQQLPSNLVQAVMTQDMLDRINSMAQNIESRATLTSIITTYNLYQKERSRLPTDDVLDEMVKAIHIDPLGSQSSATHQVPAFSVSFSYPDRHLAQKVTQDLISRFIDENVHNQSNRAYQTTEFLKSQQENAQKELDLIETRLAAYKVENNGRLPEQRSENYQKLQTLEAAAGNINSQITRIQQDKLGLESNLNFYKNQVDEQEKFKPEITAQQIQQQKSDKRIQAEKELEAWQNQLRQFQQRFTDSYPDVKTAKEEVANSQAKLDKIIQTEKDAKDAAEAAKKEVANGSKPAAKTAAMLQEEQRRDATIQQFTLTISNQNAQIETLNDQLKKTNQEIALLQARLTGVPQSEKEYVDLMRERDLKSQQYDEMTKSLAKQMVTKDMEDRKEGEQLEILDSASDPITPSFPNHPLVVGVGAAVGLLLGIVIAGAREMKDTSLKNLKDVRAYTQMAILGSIPLLENDFVVRRRRRLAWLGWTTACLAAAVLMSGSIVYYITTKQQ